MQTIKHAKFITSCTKPPYPKIYIGKFPAPEVVILGRSNVGKSSLINHLTGQKNLAKTSATPGKTQTINFFQIDNQFLLVDLPGYGFAKVSKKQQALFSKSIETYVENSKSITLLIQLLDIRHPPSSDDIRAIEWGAFYHYPTIFVLTKLDKIPKTKQKNSVDSFVRELEKHVTNPHVIPYTIKEMTSKFQLTQKIQELLP